MDDSSVGFAMLAVLLPLIAVLVAVMIARWVFRVNEQVELLKRIAAGIEYIIDADKNNG